MVGQRAYLIRDLSDAPYNMVRDAGSKNPGFDIPGWFFTGSPYGKQIVALGATQHPMPMNFCCEVVPDFGKLWKERPPGWEYYISRDTTPQPDADPFRSVLEGGEG